MSEIRTALTTEQCNQSLNAVEDSLYVIGGKWKLRIIIAVRGGGSRFNQIQKAIPGISARVLSNELKDLELNGIIKRHVNPDNPILIEYIATDYSASLDPLIKELSDWGTTHRERVRSGVA
jgi:DNA-binding HxlR family transcriptional regulator